jgi:hypothetical protein
LHEQLDGSGVIAPTGVSEHLAECARCRALSQAARLLEGGLPALATPTPPELSQRIVTRVLVARRRRLVARYALGIAAAAALLLAIPLVNWLNTPGTPTPTPGPEQAQNQQPTEPKPAPHQPEAPAPSLKSTVTKAGEAVANLTSRLADKTQKGAQVLFTAAQADLPPMTPMMPGVPELDGSFDPAARSLREVGSGLQVVTGSAQQAVNYFTRGMPTFRPKQTP